MKRRKSIGNIPGNLCKIPADVPHRHEGPGFSQTQVGWSQCPPFLGQGIVAAGLTRAPDGFSVSNIPHRGWYVMATVAGEGEAWVDGRWQTWPADRALVLPPRVFHHYRSAGGQPWDLAWVAFNRDEGVDLPAPLFAPLRAHLLAAAIDGCHHERGGGHDREIQHHWASLIGLLCRGCLHHDEDLDLEPLWDAIIADPAQQWTLGDLCRIAGCSAESLRLAVHRQTGRSPMAQVTWLRMRQAASHLLLGDERVAVIAARVGYDNPFAFSVAFKRLLGQSPAVYRGQRHGQYLVPGDPLGQPPSRGGLGMASPAVRRRHLAAGKRPPPG